MSAKYDIAIIGGGPSGSTAATFLTKKGHKVVLFEKEKFPRHHVGESLLPFCYDIFEELGVLDEMKKRFLRKPGAVFCNPEGTVETTYCFKHVVEKPKHLSFHVRRDEFDEVLLDHAQSVGADVHQSTKVVKVGLESDDRVLIEAVSDDGQNLGFEAKFVLDASGRDGLISKQNNWRIPMEGLDRTAFHSYWNFDEIPLEIKLGKIRIIYLDGDKKGWIWCIPVDHTRISIGVVVDNKYLKEFKSTKKNAAEKQVELYMHELSTSSFAQELLKDARRDEKIFINADYSYSTKHKYGKNFAMIGDSGQFIDPIFSSGVFIAMKSGMLVADALDKKLTNGDESIIDKTYEIIKNGYETIEGLIKLYYEPELLNFSSMGVSNEKKSLHFADYKDSYALLHYLLAGDFFERGHIYKEFFTELRDNKRFSKWKNLVNWDTEKSGVFNNRNEDCGEILH